MSGTTFLADLIAPPCKTDIIAGNRLHLGRRARRFLGRFAGQQSRRALVLVQLEVAERLVAKPGSRDYGYLTVETQCFTAPEILFRVPPTAFSPPPKVESAAVRLEPRPPLEDASAFLEFAGRCFRHKRKTLRNNLLPFYGRQVEAWPEAGLRAEQISIEQLVEVYRRVR